MSAEPKPPIPIVTRELIIEVLEKMNGINTEKLGPQESLKEYWLFEAILLLLARELERMGEP